METKTKTVRIKVECMECGKKFSCGPNASPECPKCGGADIEVRHPEVALASERLARRVARPSVQRPGLARRRCAGGAPVSRLDRAIDRLQPIGEPEPAYGAAAERYNAERELGQFVLAILHPDYVIDGPDKLADIRAAAEGLGLLKDGGAS